MPDCLVHSPLHAAPCSNYYEDDAHHPNPAAAPLNDRRPCSIAGRFGPHILPRQYSADAPRHAAITPHPVTVVALALQPTTPPTNTRHHRHAMSAPTGAPQTNTSASCCCGQDQPRARAQYGSGSTEEASTAAAAGSISRCCGAAAAAGEQRAPSCGADAARMQSSQEHQEATAGAAAGPWRPPCWQPPGLRPPSLPPPPRKAQRSCSAASPHRPQPCCYCRLGAAAPSSAPPRPPAAAAAAAGAV